MGTNDKSRLTAKDIEQMVADAEKYKAEDEAMKAKVEAKNGLESYCFQIKNTLNEEKLKEAFTDEDKSTIEQCATEGLQWLEANADADADAMEGKRKEIEAKFNPIMQRVYQAAGGAAGAGGMPGMGGMPGGPGGMNFPGGAPGAGPTGGDDGVNDLD